MDAKQGSLGTGTTRIPPFKDRFEFPAGRRPENPFRIVALALDRTFGDFAAVLCYAASVKQEFDHARLAVYFRDDRPYKQSLIEACPQIDAAFAMLKDDTRPLDFLDRAGEPPLAIPREWREPGWTNPNLVITPTMAQYGNMGDFEQTARFAIPAERQADLGARLAASGIDPHRWFSVIHFREPGYRNRPASALRDPDPRDFAALCRWIIEDLGGQVVRLGHPGMTLFPEMPGYADLAPVGEADTMLQLFALSRARFMIASNSGPGVVCSAFGTPTAMCNNPVRYSVWNPQDARMYCHILTADGRRLTHRLARQREMYFTGALTYLSEHGYKIVLQSLDELKALTKLMLEQTTDTLGWRSHWYEVTDRIRPNRLTLPAEKIEQSRFVFFPEFAPGKGIVDISVPYSES